VGKLDNVICFEFLDSEEFEKLIVITSNSQVIIANPRTKKLEKLVLGNSVGKIVFAIIYNQFIFIGNSADQIFIYEDAKSLSTPIPRILFSNAKSTENAIILQDPNVDTFEVWSPHESEGFYRSAGESCDHIKEIASCVLGKVNKIVSTPRYRYKPPSIAMLTQKTDIELIVCTFDLTKAVEIKVNCDGGLPKEIIWCGNHCVAGLFTNQIILIDKAKNAIFPLKEKLVHAKTEIDGIRVYTETASLFLEKVSDFITEIYSKTSIGTSAQYILELYSKYITMDPTIEQSFKNPLPDENTGIKPYDARSGCITTKVEAVINLIRFAAHQFDPEVQKYLLKAAEFSEVIVPHTADVRQEMQRIIQHLVILNEYRKIGRLLTHCEFLEQSPQTLAGIALKQQAPFLAYKVVETFKGRGKELLASYLGSMSLQLKQKVSEPKIDQVQSEYEKVLSTWKKSTNPAEFIDSIITKGITNELIKECALAYQIFYKTTNEINLKVFQGIEKMLEVNEKENYAKKFQVNEKYFGIMKLRNLARKKNWEEFLTYWNAIKSKVSIITPIRLSLEYKNGQLANKLIDTIKDPEEQSNLLLEFKYISLLNPIVTIRTLKKKLD